MSYLQNLFGKWRVQCSVFRFRLDGVPEPQETRHLKPGSCSGSARASHDNLNALDGYVGPQRSVLEPGALAIAAILTPG
jgi:hypothetical protein